VKYLLDSAPFRLSDVGAEVHLLLLQLSAKMRFFYFSCVEHEMQKLPL
jgi:hypothetical protein